MTRWVLVSIFLIFSFPVLAGEILYDEALVKGSVGALGSNIYVKVGGSKNEVDIFLDPEAHNINAIQKALTGKTPRKEHTVVWIGKDKSEPEVVLTDGRKISTNIADLDQSKLIIVMFFPTEIRITDLKDNKSYKYARS